MILNLVRPGTYKIMAKVIEIRPTIIKGKMPVFVSGLLFCASVNIGYFEVINLIHGTFDFSTMFF